MKLARISPQKETDGNKIPVVLVSDGSMVDVSSLTNDFDEAFFARGGMDTIAHTDLSKLPRIQNPKRYSPPVARPSKILCIGLNYRDHAEETKQEIPKEPIVFMKATSALCGPNDDLILPKDSRHTDWEIELAFVIKKCARYVEEKDALDYIAGYLTFIDYSERHWQTKRGGQWMKGKSFDTFATCGPYLVTTDEVPNPNALSLHLEVNGEHMQNSNTSQMIFSVPFLLSYLSQFTTLLPGDIVTTGTPAGVGSGREPKVFLKSGDTIRGNVENLGETSQQAISLTN